MPYYDFLNKKTGEIKSLFFRMNEEKKYIDSDGFEWERQFSIPCASIDTKNDPLDHKKNLQKIHNTKGTVGDMMDFSREQSEKREEKLGSDPLRNKVYENYKNKTGRDHPEKRKETLKKLTKEVMIKLDKKYK